MYIRIIVLAFVIVFSQCSVNHSVSSPETVSKQNSGSHKTKREREYPYRASHPKYIDLEHTRLEVSFNYKSREVKGKATITMHPHFYATDSIELDAVKFDLHRVSLIQGSDTFPLKYNYNDKKITLHLSRQYKGGEHITVYIDYTAHPEESGLEASEAISGAQGIYFINPDKTDKDKPREIWSQGETQSNSCWFPTIDHPNQKMTQELWITADRDEVTLSNGELIMQKDNPDQTHTDVWKQDKPHAPYLTMVAIGPFSIVKDYWRNSMEVNYYVEKEYKPYAKLIFGNTPEMLEVFSKKLGVDYPWDKFDQVVVRDYVSGAMENTTAVVHSEFLQHDSREHLDQTYEDVISHELFHHWFGDLVTCESWSNIPLNESFATYGEYIWNEHKYGRIHADKELDEKLSAYLNGTHNYNRIPIRYRYKSHEDMFDAVSYQKGGRILHMLRYTVGDSAFFQSLKLYLKNRSFKTAEIHDLRLAFEEVTGTDLNWFFDQWFLQSGHPILDFSYQFDSTKKSVLIIAKQLQDSSKNFTYRLPIKIDIYSGGNVKRYDIVLNNRIDTFNFYSNNKIDLVNIDADKILVAQINDHQSKDALTFQFKNAPLYADKWFALKYYTGNTDSVLSVDDNLSLMADYALENKSEYIRSLGLEILRGASQQQLKYFEFRLRDLIKNDPVSFIRANALEVLTRFEPASFEPLLLTKLNDSSYKVVSTALLLLHKFDGQKAMKYCKDMQSTKNVTLISAISSIYSISPDSSVQKFFIPAIKRVHNARYNIMQDYWEYLMIQLPAKQIEGLQEILNLLSGKKDDQGLFMISSQMAGQMKSQNNELKILLEGMLKKQKKDTDQIANIQKGINDLNEVEKYLNLFIEK